ncbi:MAG: hypothetical protein WD970_02870 [Patescibacteria group bacterium]
MQKPSVAPLTNMKEIGMDEIAAASFSILEKTVEESTGKTAEEIRKAPLGTNEAAIRDISPHPKVITSNEVNRMVNEIIPDD